MSYLLTRLFYSSLFIISLFDHRYQQKSRYIYLAIASISLLNSFRESAFLFTVSSHDRHRDRNKAIIRVTDAAAGR